jgi:hypothetical protein
MKNSSPILGYTSCTNLRQLMKYWPAWPLSSPSECGYAEVKMMLFRCPSKGMEEDSSRETLYVHFRWEKINPKMPASTFNQGILQGRTGTGVAVADRGILQSTPQHLSCLSQEDSVWLIGWKKIMIPRATSTSGLVQRCFHPFLQQLTERPSFLIRWKMREKHGIFQPWLVNRDRRTQRIVKISGYYIYAFNGSPG